MRGFCLCPVYIVRFSFGSLRSAGGGGHFPKLPSQIGAEPEEQDQALEKTGDGNAPPDAVESQRSPHEKPGEGDPGAGQDDAAHRGRQGFPKARKRAGRGDLHAHEKLGDAKNYQVVHSHGDDSLLCDEKAEYGLGEADQEDGAEEAPYEYNAHGAPIALPDTLRLPGPVVLGQKRVDGSGKAIRCHPGDGFDLGANLLNRYRRVPVARHHPGDDHGDAGKYHILHAGGEADAQDSEKPAISRTVKRPDMPEQDTVPQGKGHEHQGDDKLGKNGGNGGTHNTHDGKWPHSKDEDRIQYHIDDQPCQSGGEGATAVARGRKDPGKRLI